MGQSGAERQRRKRERVGEVSDLAIVTVTVYAFVTVTF